MESIVITGNKWYSFHGSGSVCLSVATQTILYFRVTIYCLFEKSKIAAPQPWQAVAQRLSSIGR